MAGSAPGEARSRANIARSAHTAHTAGAMAQAPHRPAAVLCIRRRAQVPEISSAATDVLRRPTVTGSLIRCTLTGAADLLRRIDGDDYFRIDCE